MRILVCDDNRDAADSLCVLLDIHRHQVAVCYDGPSCVENARQWRPEVAILDISMPGVDGYAVARAIRDMPFGNTALLIAMTARDAPEDVHMAQIAGFDLHFVKPADTARLVQVIGDRTDSRGSKPL